MTTVSAQIVKLPGNEDIDLPRYESEHAAGMDLSAAIAAPIEIKPGGRALVPTGIKIAVPQGFEAQIRPRSGLAARNGIIVVNSPGTIDSDYRGEIKVILGNLGEELVVIERGMRIAQMIVAPVTRVVWEPVDTLPESTRGVGGFGSTGHERR